MDEEIGGWLWRRPQGFQDNPARHLHHEPTYREHPRARAERPIGRAGGDDLWEIDVHDNEAHEYRNRAAVLRHRQDGHANRESTGRASRDSRRYAHGSPSD